MGGKEHNQRRSDAPRSHPLCLFAVSLATALGLVSSELAAGQGVDAAALPFLSFMDGGKTGAGNVFQPADRGQIVLSSASPDYPFAELLVASTSYRLSVRVLFGNPSGAMASDLAELLEQMKATCGSGELVIKPSTSWLGTDPEMAKAFRQLVRSKLVGEVGCTASDGHRLFVTTIQPGTSYESVLPFAPRRWHVFIQIIAGEALARFERRFDDYRRKTDALRASAAPGTKVQVSEAELPSADDTATRLAPGSRMISFCGLVIEVKGPLAQLQVQRSTVFVALDKIFPQGEAVPLAQLRSSTLMSSMPQAYCAR